MVGKKQRIVNNQNVQSATDTDLREATATRNMVNTEGKEIVTLTLDSVRSERAREDCLSLLLGQS